MWTGWWDGSGGKSACHVSLTACIDVEGENQPGKVVLWQPQNTHIHFLKRHVGHIWASYIRVSPLGDYSLPASHTYPTALLTQFKPKLLLTSQTHKITTWTTSWYPRVYNAQKCDTEPQILIHNVQSIVHNGRNNPTFIKSDWINIWLIFTQPNLISLKKQWNSETCQNMDGPWEHCAKWNKSDRKTNMHIKDSMHTRTWNRQMQRGIRYSAVTRDDRKVNRLVIITPSKYLNCNLRNGWHAELRAHVLSI